MLEDMPCIVRPSPSDMLNVPWIFTLLSVRFTFTFDGTLAFVSRTAVVEVIDRVDRDDEAAGGQFVPLSNSSKERFLPTATALEAIDRDNAP